MTAMTLHNMAEDYLLRSLGKRQPSQSQTAILLRCLTWTLVPVVGSVSAVGTCTVELVYVSIVRSTKWAAPTIKCYTHPPTYPPTRARAHTHTTHTRSGVWEYYAALATVTELVPTNTRMGSFRELRITNLWTSSFGRNLCHPLSFCQGYDSYTVYRSTSEHNFHYCRFRRC